jgi:hypothetical protein
LFRNKQQRARHSSRSANKGKALVKAHEGLASAPPALVLDEEESAGEIGELTAAAAVFFADDERPIAIKTDRELKRRKIDNANLCNGSHRMFLHC